MTLIREQPGQSKLGPPVSADHTAHNYNAVCMTGLLVEQPGQSQLGLLVEVGLPVLEQDAGPVARLLVEQLGGGNLGPPVAAVQHAHNHHAGQEAWAEDRQDV
jgi:hypothetical protein